MCSPSNKIHFFHIQLGLYDGAFYKRTSECVFVVRFLVTPRVQETLLSIPGTTTKFIYSINNYNLFQYFNITASAMQLRGKLGTSLTYFYCVILITAISLVLLVYISLRCYV